MPAAHGRVISNTTRFRWLIVPWKSCLSPEYFQPFQLSRASARTVVPSDACVFPPGLAEYENVSAFLFPLLITPLPGLGPHLHGSRYMWEYGFLEKQLLAFFPRVQWQVQENLSSRCTWLWEKHSRFAATQAMSLTAPNRAETRSY